MDEENGGAEPEPEGEAETEEANAEGTSQGEGMRDWGVGVFKKSSNRCLLACVPEIPVRTRGMQQSVFWLMIVNPELFLWLSLPTSRIACLTMGNALGGN